MEIQNLELYQGDTWDIDVTILSSDSTPLDLTDYNVRSTIKTKYSDSAATATFTCTKTSNVNGTIRLHLAASTTKNLTKGNYVYDMEIWKYSVADNLASEIYVYKPVGGVITVLPEVTT